MDKIQELENRIRELEKWKEQRTAQQIAFPLDDNSVTILSNYFLHIIDTITYAGGVGANTFTTYVAKQSGIEVGVDAVGLSSYVVDPSTDYLTIGSTNLKYFDNFTVILYSSVNGTAPAGLSSGLGIVYYVVQGDGSGRVFKLSATLGGAAINVTDAGTGRQFITYG